MPNDFLFELNDYSVPVATDPNKCRISGLLVDVGGAPLRKSQIHVLNKFTPQVVIDPTTELAVLGSKVIYTTDDSGFVQFDLYRNAQVDIMIPSQNPNPWSKNEDVPIFSVTIPDDSFVLLHDLLYPVPAILEFAPASPLVLAVDDSETIDVILTLSNKLISSDIHLLTMISSDATKVTVAPISDSKIVLTRLAAGTVLITAEINLAETPIRHQPPKQMIFIVNSLEDPNGFQLT